MKKLYILRHAKAELNSNITDHDRNLTEKGQQDCNKVGLFLKDKGDIIDEVICSSSIRTIDTATLVTQVMGKINCKITTNPDLYRADALIIETIIKSLDDNLEKVMIVAHNPGVHDFCFNYACNENIENALRLKLGFSPATIACFNFPNTAWRDISPTNASLEWLFTV